MYIYIFNPIYQSINQINTQYLLYGSHSFRIRFMSNYVFLLTGKQTPVHTLRYTQTVCIKDLSWILSLL